MKDLKVRLSESLFEEAKHESKELDQIHFNIGNLMSNFPYIEYAGKAKEAMEKVVESILKLLVGTFPEYKEKIETNAKKILEHGLGRMFDKYIPVKVKAKELWDSGDIFSNEGFKIGLQEQKMYDYMLKAVKNYIEKIYTFANSEVKKDDKKVTESFEEFSGMLFEARANEIEMLLDFDQFKEYFDMLFMASPDTAINYFLRHTGLSKVINERDKIRFTNEIDNAFQKTVEFKKWSHSFIKKCLKDKDSTTPPYELKEYKSKQSALDDTLKELYKLLCDLADKYDADVPDYD